jgi:hypothetical protein
MSVPVRQSASLFVRGVQHELAELAGLANQLR